MRWSIPKRIQGEADAGKNQNLKVFGYIAAFDLDKTIISGNCSFSFCRFLVSKKVLPYLALFYSCINYIRYFFFGLNLSDLHQITFKRLLKGKSLDLIRDHVEPFLNEYFYKTIYPPAFAQLRRAQHLGHYTIILSNSPSFLVDKIAERLGVDACESTQYAVDSENKLCSISSIMLGDHKAAYVENVASQLKVQKDKISAYTDSVYDLPFLLAAGTAIVVNPDRKLKALSRQNNWEIL